MHRQRWAEPQRAEPKELNVLDVGKITVAMLDSGIMGCTPGLIW